MGITQNIGASSLIKPGVIDNTAARPASPYEGQMVYEKDTDMLAIWNGTAWRYIAATTATNGTVLQVVDASYSTQTTTSSSTYADTGLSVTITPKSTSSKIFISVAQQGILKLGGTTESACSLRLVRGSTTILQWAGYLGYTGSTASNSESASTVYLDSPSTISATTYKTTFATTTNGSGTIDCQRDGVTSTIVAMEIAG